MAEHALRAAPETIHRFFSADLAPVLMVESGDRVVLNTLEAGGGVRQRAPGVEERERMEPARSSDLDGHTLCGPIGVRGARPGQMLAIEINTLVPGTWGWNRAGRWPTPLNQRLGIQEGEEHALRWTLDPAAGRGRTDEGFEVALRPFLGVIGMPPPGAGHHPTGPPRRWGGNLDCRDLVAGSTLFLPVPVDDALLSVGDGHAAQGDGELSGTAIECPMSRVELTLRIEERPRIEQPHARFPQGWLTLGLGESLDEAVAAATDGMLDLMATLFDIERVTALALASVAVHLRVTQVVNGTVGAHAVLLDDAIRRAAHP